MTVGQQAPELIIKARLGRSDIFRALFQRALWKPYILLTPICVILIVRMSLSSQPDSWTWAIVAGLIVLIVVPNSASRSAAKRGALGPITYTFSADNVSAEFEHGANRVAWSLVKGARETDGYFFVEMPSNRFYVIPKKFVDEDQAFQLRRILRNHISKHVHLSS